MTLRDQIKQTQRRYSYFAIAALVLWAPPGLTAVVIKLNGTQPPEYWPFLMMLVLVGLVLFLISAIGQWTMRCPKCQAILGIVNASKEKCCRFCGADFDGEVEPK